jgi:hypothetical protein
MSNTATKTFSQSFVGCVIKGAFVTAKKACFLALVLIAVLQSMAVIGYVGTRSIPLNTLDAFGDVGDMPASAWLSDLTILSFNTSMLCLFIAFAVIVFVAGFAQLGGYKSPKDNAA